MTQTLTNADKALLKSMGIDSEPRFEDERLALAQRIAKHTAPCQVKLSPEAARLELIRLAAKKLLAALV